ncbi:MAG: competence/damage-inducible protein A [Flavobacteriaceae bacterium]|nr:competence/damage-inducible protein A [Flavobacteriaceae bacterium]
MQAEIITIGDELLIGQVVDTNSAWLGQQLSLLGIPVKQITSCSDSEEHIVQSLQQASQRAGLIIITGGLGPTKDDITKHTLAKYFGVGMKLDEATLNRVEYIFRMRKMPMLESNRLQAMVPANCEVLDNRSGTAPGMWFKLEGHVYVSLPGVPYEMKTIFEEEVIPLIKEHFELPNIVHKTLLTAGIGESYLAEKIKTVEDALPQHIKLAYLPATAQVRLRLTGNGMDKAELTREIDHIAEHIISKVPEYFFGEGEDTLEQLANRLLTERKETLSVAESFTGGYLAHLITAVPGSSVYFMGSIVAYANSVKVSDIGVTGETLHSYGSVSEQCVKEMAEGCRKKFGTTWAMASTGVAGPGGGTIGKPVGTCYIAISGPNGTVAKRYDFGDDRGRTIQRGSIMGLDMLRRELLGIGH